MKRSISILALGMALALALGSTVWAQPSFPLSDGAEDDAASAALWTFEPEDSPWEIKATMAHLGDQVWSIVPTGGWQYLTLAGTIDLTTATNPTLSFWMRTLDGNVGFMVEVSYDAGANWETLQGHTWRDHRDWQRYQWSLESYRMPGVVLRIGALLNTAGATLQIDDVLIDDAPVPHTIRLLEPTNNGFRLVWDESTADDFRHYWILVSTRRDFNMNEGISGRQERRNLLITDKATTETTLTDLAFTNTRYYAQIFEQDTQDLDNQGSEIVDSQTAFQVTVEEAPFVQNFEGGFQWAADLPWMISEQTSGEEGHSATHAWEDSPVGTGQANYPRNADRWLVTETNFSGVERPVLRFKHRYIFQERADYGYVSYSLDNNTWTDIAVFTGAEGVWRTEEFDIGVLSRQPRAYLRFRTTSNSDSERDGWHIDDVEVYDNAKILAFPFGDDVEDEAQTRQDWTLGQWDVLTTMAQSGDQVVGIKPVTGWQYLTLAGTIDLTTASNPTLSFWMRTLDGNVGYMVQVSYNAGANWETLQGHTWRDHRDWQRYQWSLESYRMPGVVLRIGALLNTAGATLQIDDVLIDDAPVPHTIRLLEPTNNGFRLVWDESTADDFRHYWILVSTRRDFNMNEGISGRQERRNLLITDKATTETTLTDLAFTNTRYYAQIFEQDTQDLDNQGSEIVDSQTAFQVTVEEAPFVQNFEGGFQWAADLPWMISEQTSGEEGHSATHAWEDSPVGTGQANYPRNADRWLVTETNFSGVERPVLRFKHRYIFQERADYGYVSYSLDNNTWTDIAVFTGAEGVWRTEEFDIGVLSRQPRAYLRFRTTSNSDSERDGWHIDDVEVYDNAKILAFPFGDDVEDEAQTRQDWTLGQWDVLTTMAQSGDQVVGIKPVTGWQYLTLAGTIDLTTASNPTLSFWMRTLDGNVGYMVQVSYNAGANWETLQGHTWRDHRDWQLYQWSLESYRTPGVVLRISALLNTAGATLQIDDISIDFPPASSGDVSGDGEVTAFDASLVLRYLVGLSPLGSSGLVAAEVTGNGTISPLDATLILQYAAGMITIFPVDSAPKPVASAGSLEWGEARLGDSPALMILPLVLADDAQDVFSVQLDLSIDPSLAEVGDIAPRLPAGWQLAHRVENGELTLVMAGATPVAAGELAQVQLRLLHPEAQMEVGGRAFVNENSARELAPVSVRSVPLAFGLQQNYPNPFNPTTQIQYQLARSADVRLTIHNLVGQSVRSLVAGEQAAGVHTAEWDGRSDAGQRVESGLYLYRLEAPGFVRTRKMVLVQ